MLCASWKWCCFVDWKVKFGYGSYQCLIVQFYYFVKESGGAPYWGSHAHFGYRGANGQCIVSGLSSKERCRFPQYQYKVSYQFLQLLFEKLVWCWLQILEKLIQRARICIWSFDGMSPNRISPKCPLGVPDQFSQSYKNTHLRYRQYFFILFYVMSRVLLQE